MKIKNGIFLFVIVLVISAVCVASFTSCAQKSETVETSAETSAETEIKTVYFTVTDGEGSSTDFMFSTSADNIRDALEEMSLIKGDEGQYGLYVKEVNGIRADYDLDGAYWCFYLNETMLSTSVDEAKLHNGDKIAAVYTK